MKEISVKIKLRTLSPVHIGSGEEFDFTRFTIDEKARQLVEFDILNFIKTLSVEEKKELSSICERDAGEAIVGIYRFIYHRRKRISGNRIPVSEDVVKNYKRIINMEGRVRDNDINKFCIKRTIINPLSSEPYIPGSSVKGALRTAYLNMLADDFPPDFIPRGDEKKDHKKLEARLLRMARGSFDEDPFRFVKVSDFKPIYARKKIMYEVNRKKVQANRGASGLSIAVEAIMPDAIFEGTIKVVEPTKEQRMNHKITLDRLLSAAEEFYKKVYDAESKVLNRIGASKVGFPSGNGCLIRIGRHSGAEAVTLERFRKIKIMQGRHRKPEYSSKGATTIWLASDWLRPRDNNGLKPFGWVWIELI